MRRNRAAFDGLELVPRVLRDVSHLDTGTSVLGCPTALPIVLAPVGAPRMFHHEGELAVARAAGVTPPEASAVATRDARTLLELEKLRIAREKDEAREQRDQGRQARAAQVRHKTCARLRLRHKWAQEDLARADGKSQEAARRKARRQAEALAVECPA